MTKHIFITALLLSPMCLSAQSVTRYVTTEGAEWKSSKTSLSSSPSGKTVVTVDTKQAGVPFVAWGTTFNELDLDAFSLVSAQEQEEVMKNLFDPEGDLRFSRGRVSMNANDYARAWYQCDSVAGDFELRYFNIEHDKQNIIRLAKAAQKYRKDLSLWVSPWSPPSWMKINQDYPVLPSKYNNLDPRKASLLYMDDGHEVDEDEMKLLGDRDNVYPRRLATQDYFIQDPRYLQAYADMFCKFIDLYAAEGLPISKVMYQNEAYSYTPYPGCAWTAEGTVRFNTQYLAPTLKKRHPEVELWIGTFNTNRLDYVEKILDDEAMQKCGIVGVGTQWECRNNLPQMRERYPNWHFMCSESECGNGDMDWQAGEHTFFLLADNLGNGCDEYYNWNFMLCDHGESAWGWKQNGLIHVDSQTHAMRYTPEYFAYKHFSHFVAPGDEMVGYSGREYSDSPVVVYRNGNRYTVVAGNFTDKAVKQSVKIGRRYLNISSKPHSFNTYIVEL